MDKQPATNKILPTFLIQNGNSKAPVQFFALIKLWKSTGYILEPMATDAPFQNGQAECQNHTLEQMMQCFVLHAANLGSEFWSFALQHSVYLKNHLPHSATNASSFFFRLDLIHQANPSNFLASTRSTVDNLVIIWGNLTTT